MDILIDLIAGSTGGAAGVLFGHPLDVMKVRMQQNATYNSLLDCAVKTFRGEGPIGFLKGVGPPLMSVALYQAVCFASFSVSLALVTEDTEEDASMKSLFVAGCMSGLATVPVTTPTDLVKIRLQLQTESGSKRLYSGMLDCARKIIQSEGLYGLVRGFEATMYRDIASTGLYFVAYHQVKRSIQKSDMFGCRSEPAELIAGGCAGVVSWGSTCPIDVIKTHIQANTSAVRLSFWGCLTKTVQDDGIKHLFRGISPLLIRAFFVNAITFYAYEESLRCIDAAKTYFETK